jgi:hypothetical protein
MTSPTILSPTLVWDRDISVAREAAARIAERQGYPGVARGYRRGEWDEDAEVQSALEAVRMTK